MVFEQARKATGIGFSSRAGYRKRPVPDIRLSPSSRKRLQSFVVTKNTEVSEPTRRLLLASWDKSTFRNRLWNYDRASRGKETLPQMPFQNIAADARDP